MSPETRAPRQRKWGWVALAGVFLLLLLWVGLSVEWSEESIDLGYGEDAHRNPLLAAELFLRQAELEADTVGGLSLLDSLPSSDAMLVLAASRRSLSERRESNLIEWVESGGHLVMVASELYQPEQGWSRDSLLDYYGIHLLESQDEEAEEALEVDSDDPSLSGGSSADGDHEHSPAANSELADDEEEDQRDGLRRMWGEGFGRGLGFCFESESRLSTLTLAGEDEPLRIELAGSTFLEAPDAPDGGGFTAYSESGPQMVHRRMGAGVVTVSTSLEIWANRNIHCHDHAYLLWMLGRGASKTWLLHDPEIPPLLAQLRAGFPFTGLSLIALILLWACSRSLRFAMREDEGGGERRELLEHLEASAYFLWRRGELAASLNALRRDVLRGRFSGRERSTAIPDAGQMQDLAGLCGLSVPELQLALRDSPPATRREFTQMMRALNALRRGP